MQVVYSGGSSTPNPSPRLIRKDMRGSRYIRPVMPAYFTHNLPPRGFTKCQSRVKPSDNEDVSLKNFIPAMSKPVAITCLVCNILFPGLGTFISGLTLMCGSQVRPPETTRSNIIWTNTWIAGLQFITTFLFLLGWIWSVLWGVSFLSISDDYNSEVKAKNAIVIEEAKNCCHSNGATGGNSSSSSTAIAMTTASTTTSLAEKPSDDVMIPLTDSSPTLPQRSHVGIH